MVGSLHSFHVNKSKSKIGHCTKNSYISQRHVTGNREFDLYYTASNSLFALIKVLLNETYNKLMYSDTCMWLPTFQNTSPQTAKDVGQLYIYRLRAVSQLVGR
jgi:hypothetical protein